MDKSSRYITLILVGLIALGTLAGLAAARLRWRVEARNRLVEIGLEWPEVTTLAQMSHQPLTRVLARLKEQHATSLIIAEDTLLALEQAGAIHPNRITRPDGSFSTIVQVDSLETLQRIRTALQIRGIPEMIRRADSSVLPDGTTAFGLAANPAVDSTPSGARSRRGAAIPASAPDTAEQVQVSVDYANLRLLGLGLPPDAVAAARAAHYYIVGRISNFPGVTPESAKAVLLNLRRQHARMVIFNGEDVLGYRSLEKDVAALLRGPDAGKSSENDADAITSPTGLTYGAVEFSKQRGDATLTAALQGEFVRVHALQAAEMGQLDPDEVVERFVRAVRERNIRFCFVRLPFQVGPDPVEENVRFLGQITHGLERGSLWNGGGLEFGAAHWFRETGVPRLLFVLLALGTVAGAVWMVRAFCPLPRSLQSWLLLSLGVICAGLALSETGRKLVALLAGIAFPAVACLTTYPRPTSLSGNGFHDAEDNSRWFCIRKAVGGLALASAITLLGIVHVVGLLATRPFMLRADQFLGIKPQHAIPVLIIALAAMIGGVPAPAERWRRFKARAEGHLRAALDEPARYGLLLLGLVALAGLAIVVIRSGNDTGGMGVSSIEMRFRGILDRLMPARPRTKEFLIGHPAFVLALAWWWRGRRRLAIPAFIVGSIGQVSILNTFCHIHTPLILSVWRDGAGLALGALLGILVFLILERFLPEPESRAITYRIEEPYPHPAPPDREPNRLFRLEEG